MTKDRTLKWWYVGVIILVLCGAGLFIYQTYILKDSKKAEPKPTPTPTATATPTATPEQSVALDVTSDEVTNLFKSLDRGLGMYCGNFLYFTDKKFDASQFTNVEVYQIAVYNMGVYALDGNGQNFTAAQLDEKIHAIFGAGYQFTHQSYRTCPLWNYNSGTQTYEYQGAECGGTCGPISLKKVVKATKTGSTIEAYVRVVFSPKQTDINLVYYKDYQRTIPLNGLELDAQNYAIESDTNIAKGSLYKVTFTNENGNYVFVSSELAE